MGGEKKGRISKSISNRQSHLKVSPNNKDDDCVDVIDCTNEEDCLYRSKNNSKNHHQHRRCSSKNHVIRRTSRKNNRVHPAMPHFENNDHSTSNNNDNDLSNSNEDGLVQRRQQWNSGSGSMNRNGKHKNRNVLTIETNRDDHNTSSSYNTSSNSTPNGLRGRQDLRSPGMPESPAAGSIGVSSPKQRQQQQQQQQGSLAIPDFITQTDANGNASTPRSAHAINNAQVGAIATKVYPSTDDNGRVTEMMMTETCESIVDSFRLMMCCCLVQPEINHEAIPQKISGKETQDSDDNNNTEKESTDIGIKQNIIHNNKLLGSLHPNDAGKKCLVLDLDETLVHSSFRAVEGADFVIPVQIEDVVHFVYVAKRPGVDEFLIEMAKHYEIVIYTASLNKYADPLLDLLDPKKVIRYRLFRESCVFYEGNYIKDLSVLDRDLSSTIIIDNSPNSYLFHPENAIDCSSFIDDLRDRELDQIGSFLTGIRDAKDVRGICCQWRDWPGVNPGEKEKQEESRLYRR